MRRINRHQAREIAIKVLYQWDLARADPEAALAYLCQEEEPDEGSRAFAAALVAATRRELPAIDETIRRYARSWRLERLAYVDRSILRLAVCEMLFWPDTPVSVAIDEAVELAKRYGGAESSRFINGILGQLARDREARAPAAASAGQAPPGALAGGDATAREEAPNDSTDP